MGGNDDLGRVDAGVLSRAPCERSSSRSHINPWAEGRPPGPISGEDIRKLDQLGWIPHPLPPPPVPIEQQVRLKIVELALSQRTELTGVELAQTVGTNNAFNPPAPIRKGGAIVLSYFEKAWPESYADIPHNQGARNEVLYRLNHPPLPPDKKPVVYLPDWCGIFALWVIKTAVEKVGHGPTLGTWADAIKKGVGINGVGGFRTRSNAERPLPGDVAFVKGKTGHRFVVHSFRLGPKEKIDRIFSIDGNSDNAAVTTSAPDFQPGFDRKKRTGYSADEILLYCTIF